MDKQQIFIHQKIYPNPQDIFDIDVKPLEDIIGDCIFIIDTNILLLPYTTTSSGFEEIKKAYAKLISKKQIFIPAQVAREFAKNRPEKIKTLFQQLNVNRSKIQKVNTGQYPLLESLPEYNEAIEIERQIQEANNKYSVKINEILEQIKGWRWNDPVSSVYKDLFKSDIIKELSLSEDAILSDLELRNKYNIPPGFNDKTKDDHGVGDLIIWLTILELAKEKGKDVVFVSGDEKNDWFYRSENQSLYPRFELLTEFKVKTGQTTFHIIKLSQLLTILGATQEAVKEVEIREIDTVGSFDDIRNFSVSAEKSVYKWLLENYTSKEIQINRGYPDFIIKDSEKIEGIDVMPLREIRSIMHLNRLRERFMRAYYEINEGDLDCFKIIVVIRNPEQARTVYDYLNKHTEKFKNEFIQILLGIITEDGNFSPIG